MKKWEVLESDIAFDNRWMKVRRDKVRLGNGKMIDDYYVWEQGDIAMVVAVTLEKEMILVRQYRHAVNDFMIELPAGLVDTDEKPEEAARRELLEETGFAADHLLPLGVFAESPAKVAGRTHVFLAIDATKIQEVQLDSTEEIELITKSWKEVLAMVRDGRISGTASVAATWMALDKLELL